MPTAQWLLGGSKPVDIDESVEDIWARGTTTGQGTNRPGPAAVRGAPITSDGWARRAVPGPAICVLDSGNGRPVWRLCGLICADAPDQVYIYNYLPCGPSVIPGHSHPAELPVVLNLTPVLDEIVATIADWLLAIEPSGFLASTRGRRVDVTTDGERSCPRTPRMWEHTLRGQYCFLGDRLVERVPVHGGYRAAMQLYPVNLTGNVLGAKLCPAPGKVSLSEPVDIVMSTALRLVVAQLLDGFPGLKAVWVPQAGAGRTVQVSLDYLFPGQAYQLIHRIFGQRELNWIRRVIVVDSDVDICDQWDVEWAIATRVQPGRDVLVIDGMDGSGSYGPDGSRWAVDATNPRYEYAADDSVFPEQCFDEDVQRKVAARWSSYGLGEA